MSDTLETELIFNLIPYKPNSEFHNYRQFLAYIYRIQFTTELFKDQASHSRSVRVCACECVLQIPGCLEAEPSFQMKHMRKYLTLQQRDNIRNYGVGQCCFVPIACVCGTNLWSLSERLFLAIGGHPRFHIENWKYISK